MLNKLWGLMIVAGICVAAFTGRIGTVSTSVIDSAREAVTLCITMMGIMALWTGIMNIAKKAGIIDCLLYTSKRFLLKSAIRMMILVNVRIR